MAKKNAGPDTKWTVLDTDGEDRPVVDMKEDGAQVVGSVTRVKTVEATYEGERRPRTLVVLDVEGEPHSLWLPEMMAEDMARTIGKLVRVTRKGQGPKNTRYRVEVAG